MNAHEKDWIELFQESNVQAKQFILDYLFFLQTSYLLYENEHTETAKFNSFSTSLSLMKHFIFHYKARDLLLLFNCENISSYNSLVDLLSLLQHKDQNQFNLLRSLKDDFYDMSFNQKTSNSKLNILTNSNNLWGNPLMKDNGPTLFQE